MPHERQLIRDALVASLVAANTSAGSDVFKSRAKPLRSVELPAICVYTDSETVAEGSGDSAPRELKRTVNVAVDVWIKLPPEEEIDDEIDSLALEVETVLDRNRHLRNEDDEPTAFDTVLVSTEIGIDTSGDQPIACAHMVYAVDYHTSARIADPVDDFDTAGIDFVKVDGETELEPADQTQALETDIHE